MLSLKRNSKKAVLAKMSLTECKNWKTYLNKKIQLLYIDWEADKKISPILKKDLRTAHYKVEALNYLYLTD